MHQTRSGAAKHYDSLARSKCRQQKSVQKLMNACFYLDPESIILQKHFPDTRRGRHIRLLEMPVELSGFKRYPKQEHFMRSAKI